MNFNPKENPKAEKILRGLYKFKNALNKKGVFTRDELLKGLKEIGLPSNKYFWASLCKCTLPTQKCKLITRIYKGAYAFTKPNDPVYWGDLQAIYDFYTNIWRRYQKSNKRPEGVRFNPNLDKEVEDFWKSFKNPPKEEVPKAEVVAVEDEVTKAINLLKSHGYQVYAPVGVIYAKV